MAEQPTTSESQGIVATQAPPPNEVTLNDNKTAILVVTKATSVDKSTRSLTSESNGETERVEEEEVEEVEEIVTHNLEQQ